MVNATPIKVEVKSDRDAMAAIEAVEEDGVPREIERNGKIIAVVKPPMKTERREWNPSPEAIERAKAAAGSWKDIPELADVGERVQRWRKESPPSEPVSW